jgi:hypothetical protein
LCSETLYYPQTSQTAQPQPIPIYLPLVTIIPVGGGIWSLQEKEIRELAQESFCNPTGKQTYQLQNFSTIRHPPLDFPLSFEAIEVCLPLL